MWKILTVLFREEIDFSLICHELFAKELNGWFKRIRGWDDLVYINEYFIKKSKACRENVAIAWIDYKKANDIIPQSDK